jgi:hypothetical protein
MSRGAYASSAALESDTRPTRANVLMKLDLRDRVQAVVRAYETGLVQPGEL